MGPLFRHVAPNFDTPNLFKKQHHHKAFIDIKANMCTSTRYKTI